MQTDRARLLRQVWGDKPCSHPRIEEEYNLGYETGDYLCTTCGKEFPKSEIESPQEKSDHTDNPNN
jgi:hypothetical protein